jgi:hypothetical protein
MSTSSSGSIPTGITTSSWNADAVWALQNDNAVGPLANTATKVPGVDALPAGATYNSSTSTVTITTNGVTLDGWDFRGKTLEINASNFFVQNSRFNNALGSNYYINIGKTAVVTSGRITKCLFDGEGATNGSYSTAIWVNTNGSGGIEIDTSRFMRTPADCITINGPADLGDAPLNLIHHNYFTVGAYNNPLAHFDAITCNGGYTRIYSNLFDLTPDTNTYGTNNCLRLFGFQKLKLEICNNIFTGYATLASYPIQIGGTYVFSVSIYDNLVTANTGGAWFYPNPTSVLRSSGNKFLATGGAAPEMPVITNSTGSIATDTTGPAISSSAAQSIVEGQTLTLTLTSPEAVDWSIFGPDASKFTLTRSILTFTAPSFSAPTDANADNTYQITIVAKDGLGNATAQAFAATVTSATVDPAVAWNQRLTDLGTAPDATRKSLYDALFAALKSGATSGTNLLTKLDILYVLAAHSYVAARQNLIANQFNASVVGAASTFTTDRGYRGSSGTSYLDTGFNPTTAPGAKYTQNDASFGVFTRTLGGLNDGYVAYGTIGAIQSGGTTAATVSSRFNTTTGLTTTGSFLPGFLNLSRSTTSGSNYTVGNGTSRETITRGTTALTSNNLLIGKAATVNSAGGDIMAHWAGASLSQAEETDLKNALTTFFQAIGAI